MRTQPGLESRSRILDLIRASGRISRVELARLSGLNDATISNLVRRMIDDGLVVEAGFSPSTGGKPRRLLGINSRARHAVGVSLDYARQTIVVADLSGQMVGRLSTVGPAQSAPEEAVTRVAGQLRQLLADVQVDPATVVGVGVASPGPLDRVRGALRGQQPTSAWRDFPLEEALGDRSGFAVVLDNDASCAALGEYWTTRRSTPAPVSATVFMADGIGCGILVDGGLFHGVSSNAGELGHISLDIGGPECWCGSRGCVEVFASPAAVVLRAGNDAGLVRSLGLDMSPAARRADFTRIARAAARGDTACQRLIVGAAGYLGAAVVALANILDIGEVFLSGPGFAEAGAIYATVVQRHLDQGTFARNVHPVRVKMSHLGNDAAALGAAALMLQQELTPHSANGILRREVPSGRQ